MGLYASLKASAAQMSTTPPSRAPSLLLTECVVGDRVLAGICEAQMGEDLGIALLNVYSVSQEEALRRRRARLSTHPHQEV